MVSYYSARPAILCFLFGLAGDGLLKTATILNGFLAPELVDGAWGSGQVLVDGWGGSSDASIAD